MKYDPNKHHRRSIRLKEYDYSSPGAYFITICTYQRQHLFGDIVDGVMKLNQYGQIIQSCWQRIPIHFANVLLDAWVVMPNHLHGILVLTDTLGEGEAFGKGEAFGNKTCEIAEDACPNASPLQFCGTQSGSIGAIVQNYKSISTLQINYVRHTPGIPVWQRNYHDRIIRDEEALQRIREYVKTNPLAWEIDQLHPDNPSK